MNEAVLILAAGLVLCYGAFSKLAARSIVTPHMVFMLVGVLAGPLGLGLIQLELDHEAVALLATVALVIIL